MITEIQAQALRRVVRQLVLAEIANSWAGAADPDDVDILEQDLKEAKHRFADALKKLQRNGENNLHELRPDQPA